MFFFKCFLNLFQLQQDEIDLSEATLEQEQDVLHRSDMEEIKKEKEEDNGRGNAGGAAIEHRNSSGKHMPKPVSQPPPTGHYV